MKYFVTQDQKQIRDGFGKRFTLKGVGLGGWLLPEGYMWGNHKYYERPRRFEELVLSRTDQTYFDQFYKQYYDTFITKRDFEYIKNQGYNSIRLPINFRLFMEENEVDSTVVFKEFGFQMVDRVIEYCKEYGLYIILDLHGAPGGQTGANIDDSKYDKPLLFTQKIYQDQTVTLWKELARRYQNEKIIAAYDLLNEPLPDWNKHLYSELVPLYKRLIQEIRTIDQNHMISLEGVHWATDVSVFDEVLDDNVILHFHKYWNVPSIESIQHVIDKANELNQPLFMGEGGENDLYWYAAAFKMFDQLNISWNFWTYKKIDNRNSLVSFKRPDGWNQLFDQDNPPSKEVSKTLFDQFLHNIQFDQCTYNQEVTNHLFRKDQVIIPSAFYDYYGDGISFHTTMTGTNVIRNNDQTHICNAKGSQYVPHFSRFSDEDKALDKYPYVIGTVGDFFNYTFHTSTLYKRKRVQVEVFEAELEILINGEYKEAVYQNGVYTVDFEAKNYDFVVTLKCKKQGLIRRIQLK